MHPTFTLHKKPRWLISTVILYSLIAVIGLSSCDNTSQKAKTAEAAEVGVVKQAFPLKEIAGRSEAEVAKILGKGRLLTKWKDQKSGCTACPKYAYKEDAVEIIYINGKADRITINHLEYMDFNEDFITILGLPAATPGFKNDAVMRWYGHENFKEIMAFENGQGKVDYALIKTVAD